MYVMNSNGLETLKLQIEMRQFNQFSLVILDIQCDRWPMDHIIHLSPG